MSDSKPYHPLVIFLDVDGVLNNCATKDRIPDCGLIGLDEDKLQIFKNLVRRLDAYIVLSSTWRLHPKCENYLWKRLGAEIEERVVGKTKHGRYDSLTGLYQSASRGEEIQDYLDSHPEIQRFIILDDANIVGPKSKRHIQTSWSEGLTPELAAKAEGLK